MGAAAHFLVDLHAPCRGASEVFMFRSRLALFAANACCCFLIGLGLSACYRTHTAVGEGDAGEGDAGSVPSCPARCDDGSPCTVDICVRDVGCVSNPVEDGTLCGEREGCAAEHLCSAGVCEATAVPDGVACDDRDPCTESDRCVARVCTGTPVDAPASMVGELETFGAEHGRGIELEPGRFLFVDVEGAEKGGGYIGLGAFVRVSLVERVADSLERVASLELADPVEGLEGGGEWGRGVLEIVRMSATRAAVLVRPNRVHFIDVTGDDLREHRSTSFPWTMDEVFSDTIESQSIAEALYVCVFDMSSGSRRDHVAMIPADGPPELVLAVEGGCREHAVDVTERSLYVVEMRSRVSRYALDSAGRPRLDAETTIENIGHLAAEAGRVFVVTHGSRGERTLHVLDASSLGAVSVTPLPERNLVEFQEHEGDLLMLTVSGELLRRTADGDLRSIAQSAPHLDRPTSFRTGPTTLVAGGSAELGTRVWTHDGASLTGPAHGSIRHLVGDGDAAYSIDHDGSRRLLVDGAMITAVDRHQYDAATSLFFLDDAISSVAGRELDSEITHFSIPARGDVAFHKLDTGERGVVDLSEHAGFAILPDDGRVFAMGRTGESYTDYTLRILDVAATAAPPEPLGELTLPAPSPLEPLLFARAVIDGRSLLLSHDSAVALSIFDISDDRRPELISTARLPFSGLVTSIAADGNHVAFIQCRSSFCTLRLAVIEFEGDSVAVRILDEYELPEERGRFRPELLSMDDDHLAVGLRNRFLVLEAGAETLREVIDLPMRGSANSVLRRRGMWLLSSNTGVTLVRPECRAR